MKIYICSDIHNQFDKFYPSDPVDLVLCAGDITNWGYRMERYFLDKAIKWLDDLSGYGGNPVLFVPGNHDIGWNFLNETKYAQNILDRTFSFYESITTMESKAFCLAKSLNISGASMSPCYDMPNLATLWDNMTANTAVEQVYYESLAPCDILVSHCPPSGDVGFCTINQKDFGSTELRKWIEKNQPKLVVCGHIHDALHREEMIGATRVINTARLGRIIEL